MSLPKLYKVSPMAVLGIFLMAIGVSAWFIALPLLALAAALGCQWGTLLSPQVAGRTLWIWSAW